MGKLIAWLLGEEFKNVEILLIIIFVFKLLIVGLCVAALIKYLF